MTRTQQQGLLLAGLAVVMVAVYARALKPSSVSSPSEPVISSKMVAPPATSAARARSAAQTKLAAPSPAVREAQQDRVATLRWSRDPFLRGSAVGQMSGLMLSGVLWDDAQPMAIINGTMVQVGQELEGFHILAIGRDRVSVSDGTESFDLHVAP